MAEAFEVASAVLAWFWLISRKDIQVALGELEPHFYRGKR